MYNVYVHIRGHIQIAPRSVITVGSIPTRQLLIVVRSPESVALKCRFEFY